MNLEQPTGFVEKGVQRTWEVSESLYYVTRDPSLIVS